MKRSNSKRSSKQKPWENQGYNRGRGSCGAGVPIGTASQGCGKPRHEVRRESRVGSVAAQAQVSEEDRLRAGWYALLRSEEHTSELQSLMRISYAVFLLTKNIIL